MRINFRLKRWDSRFRHFKRKVDTNYVTVRVRCKIQPYKCIYRFPLTLRLNWKTQELSILQIQQQNHKTDTTTDSRVIKTLHIYAAWDKDGFNDEGIVDEAFLESVKKSYCWLRWSKVPAALIIFRKKL